MQTPSIRIQTISSPPMTVQDSQLFVRSQAVQLRVPNVNGGLIWNRPVAAVLRSPDGQEKVIPILDITRLALYILAGLSLTTLFLFLFLRRK